MARRERPDCYQCAHRWMIDVDLSGEYGHWIIHGCTKPNKHKFYGDTQRGCAEYQHDVHAGETVDF